MATTANTKELTTPMKKNEFFTEALGKSLEAQAQNDEEAAMIAKSFKPDEETIALNALYDEFEQATGKKKKDLGEKILAKRPDDLDVKVELLYEENLPPRDTLRHLDGLLEEAYPHFAKEGGLKDDKYAHDYDNLYLYLCCRPYLRALNAKYSLLIKLDDKAGAAQVAKKLLYYSVDDNLGIRIKASCLFFYLQDQEMIDLLRERYHDDTSFAFASAFDKYYRDHDAEAFVKAVKPFNLYLAFYCTGQLLVEDEDFRAANRSGYFRHNSLEEATDYLQAVLDSYGNDAFNDLVRHGQQTRRLVDFAAFVKENPIVMEVVCPLYFIPECYQNGVSRNYLMKVAGGKTIPGAKRKMFESLLYKHYQGREKDFEDELRYLDYDICAIYQARDNTVYVTPSGAGLASTFAYLMEMANPLEDGIASA